MRVDAATHVETTNNVCLDFPGRAIDSATGGVYAVGAVESPSSASIECGHKGIGVQLGKWQIEYKVQAARLNMRATEFAENGEPGA